MAIFTTRIRHVTLTLSPFSSEQMAEIGRVMVSTITDRIKSAVDVQDNPAPPLVKRYADRKTAPMHKNKYGRMVGPPQPGLRPVRDWTWRGRTLASIKVKSASEDQVTVGFVTEEAKKIVNGIQRYGAMWGTSPKDLQVLDAISREIVRTQRMVRVKRVGQAASAA